MKHYHFIFIPGSIAALMGTVVYVLTGSDTAMEVVCAGAGIFFLLLMRPWED